MTLLTILLHRDGEPGGAEAEDLCTFTYDVDAAYTYAPDEDWDYEVDEAYTYNPCADD